MSSPRASPRKPCGPLLESSAEVGARRQDGRFSRNGRAGGKGASGRRTLQAGPPALGKPPAIRVELPGRVQAAAGQKPGRRVGRSLARKTRRRPWKKRPRPPPTGNVLAELVISTAARCAAGLCCGGNPAGRYSGRTNSRPFGTAKQIPDRRLGSHPGVDHGHVQTGPRAGNGTGTPHSTPDPCRDGLRLDPCAQVGSPRPSGTRGGKITPWADADERIDDPKWTEKR